MSCSGKVYLVGAGPGHPELLTVKAAALLRTADVVVYDRLIQEEVLALAKPSAERLFMGKPVGRHDSRQEEIHDVLARKAREGKMVVRLKGGDPFLFGRGGEEAESLAEHGIPFEVIPGVSSALAAPLSAGIAVTHRDAASGVAIVTGHEAKNDASRLDWAALARMDTLVFLMGVHNLERIATRLIAHGRDPDTPAAVIQMAFWHDERVVTATLATIARETELGGIKPPATLVIGDVVRLREKLKHSARDLRRTPDRSGRFDPAPVPDQLLRLAAGGLGSQVLGLALERGLFDRLDAPAPPAGLAAALGIDAAALEEMLEVLVAQGLVERTLQGYRNLPTASRYLVTDSPVSLRDPVLHQAGIGSDWSALARYLDHGCSDFVAAGDAAAVERSSEALARFAAPLVVDKIEVVGQGPVEVLGWGGEAYARAFAARWPDLSVTTRNPFRAAPGNVRLLPPVPAERPSVIVLSGLLESCNRGEVQQFLERAASALAPGGRLVLHDAFLPASPLPPPEVVLATLGRHVTRGGCRSWSVGRLSAALAQLGFAGIRSEPLPAATLLVTATR